MFFGAWSGRFPDEAAQNFREILELYEAGKIDPLIGAEYPLEDYALALRDLSERRAIGKVVVNVAPPESGADT